MSPQTRPRPAPADLAAAVDDEAAARHVDTYRAALPDGDVEQFALTGLDRADVPVWAVSVHPHSEDHPPSGRVGGGGIGYGPTDTTALRGALGELLEMQRSVVTLAPQERTEASTAELRRREGRDRVVDPRSLTLEVGTPYDDDRPLQWLPLTRLRDGEQVWAPAELVASTTHDLPGPAPSAGWLTTVITNGMGAGCGAGARERAVGHALLEVLQRDGNGLAFRALDTGRVLDVSRLDDPVVTHVLHRLDAEGVDVLLKVATTQLGVPVLHAVGASRGELDADVPVRTTAAGEAAHPDLVAAARKALLEMAAARARKTFMHADLDVLAPHLPPSYLQRYRRGRPADRLADEDRALETMLAWLDLPVGELRGLLEDSVLSRRETVAPDALPSVRPGALDDPRSLLDDVTSRLAADDAVGDVLVRDLAGAPGHEGGPDVAVAKVLVPGLDVEQMSYGRVGERSVRRLVDGDLAGSPAARLVAVGERPDGSGWQPVLLTDEGRERVGGPAWWDREAADRLVGGLYPLYREPGRHTAPLVRERRRAAA